MKKLSIVLLLLILLVGCGGNAAPPESSAPASLADLPEEGLVMAMERPIYDPSVTSCIYFIRNGTQETVEFGEPYRLQYWKNGGWQDPQEDACFTAIGYCLPPGETKALSCWLGENQKPGNYRLVKEVDGETLYAQFKLGESIYTAEKPYGFVPLEELDRVPDVQGPISPEGGPGDLAEFVQKTRLDVPCQLRLVQGDGGVTDVIYENRHFLLRTLSEGQIAQTRFSYLVTDGQDLFLSNRAEWDEEYKSVKVLPEAGTELVQMVQDITAARLEGNGARFRIWSEDGVWDAMFTDVPTEFGVGWQKPGEGSWGQMFDLQYWDGMETAILDLSWQEDNTLLLTCQTSNGAISLLTFDPQIKQLCSASAN